MAGKAAKLNAFAYTLIAYSYFCLSLVVHVCARSTCAYLWVYMHILLHLQHGKK